MGNLKKLLIFLNVHKDKIDLRENMNKSVTAENIEKI